ncbi:MAG: SPASM domain-containing protein, partial [Actinomycetes bacterium]
LMIAIDGTTKEVYEQIRLSSQHEFEEVVENARSFLERKRGMSRSKPHTILSIIVMDETQSQLDDFESFWKMAGADEVLFKRFGTWGNQFDGLLELVEDAGVVAQPRENPCYFLWESMVVSWNGLVVPCCNDYDAKEVLGDVNHQTLKEIWNGEAYQRLRKNELGGCNDSSLCAGCDQAPGHRRERLWPVRR